MTADDIQQTLTDLTSPTITLIEKFCDTPSEVKVFFGGMLAVYENDPTPQNAEKINNIIKSRMDREEKKTWLKNELSNVSPEVIAAVQEKYIKNKEAVPSGLPPFGRAADLFGLYSPADQRPADGSAGGGQNSPAP